MFSSNQITGLFDHQYLLKESVDALVFFYKMLSMKYNI